MCRRIDHFRTMDVLFEADITPGAKLTAMALLRFANKDTAKCFPSILTLCDITGIKTTAMKRSLAELKEAGLLNWKHEVPKHGQSKTNHYSLLFVMWSESDQSKDNTKDKTGNQSNNRSSNQSPDQSKSDHESYDPIEPSEDISTDDPPGPPGHLSGLSKKVSVDQWDKYFAYSEWFLKEQKETLGRLVNITPASIKKGAKTLDNLIRVQGFEKETVHYALEWGIKDSFWQDQLRSLGGLDKKSKSNGQSKFSNLLTAYRRSVMNAR